MTSNFTATKYAIVGRSSCTEANVSPAPMHSSPSARLAVPSRERNVPSSVGSSTPSTLASRPETVARISGLTAISRSTPVWRWRASAYTANMFASGTQIAMISAISATPRGPASD